MKISLSRGRRAAVAALSAAALTLASTAIVLPGASADVAPAPVTLAKPAPSGNVPLTPEGAPQTIPGLSTWTAGSGEFTLGAEAKVIGADEALTGNLAEQLAEVLGRQVATGATGAMAGDLEVILDPSRGDALGDEGYELVVADTIKVTGATDTGAFYGTQTMLQILTQGNKVSKGSSIDVPQYVERGVGLCACQMTISMESLERTMKDMAYNKMNQLWLETKLKSDAYPKANFWAYYTKAEAAQISAWAKKYHIELVLEVNSPGHMRPWLYDYPELQLVNNSGQKKVEQLDISKPEAFEMITTLVDEYAAAFPDQPYWHMGGDEYMMGDSYSNYSQFAAYVAAHPEIFPAGSGPGDVFIWFMNKVNAYVKSTGKQLRIWNDGLPASSVVPLDKDILVEYWHKGPSLSAQEVLNAGHDVQNATQTFYFSRPGAYGRDLNNLWNSGWTPQTMNAGEVVVDVPGKGKVLGAKLSAWPDDTPLTTEAEVEEQIFDSMRFLAQANWGGPKPTADYGKFSALSATLGRVPGYNSYDRTPVGNGGYAIATAGQAVNSTDTGVTLSATDAGQVWQFTATDDNYYKISTAAGKCLAMAGGVLWLQAPMQQDLAPSLSDCATTDARVKNLQKWEILKVDGGYKIRNAITQMPLSVNASGALTQQAADVVAPSVFALAGEVSTSVAAPERVVPGSPATVTVTVDNRTANPITDAVVTPEGPSGWKFTPASITVGDVPAGATKTATFVATPSATAVFGDFTVTAATAYKAGAEALVSNSTDSGLLTCSPEVVRPVDAAVDSFNNGQGEVTPALNAIDGNPNTFWGTAWTPSNTPLPHAITVHLEEELSICAINALPRQGSSSGAANGRIKDYEVYVSKTVPTISDVASLGTKVAEGTFANEASMQKVFLDTPAVGRYVTLRALSEQAGNPWTTLAELSLDAIDPALIPTDPPTTEPTDEPTVDPTDEPTVGPTDEPTDPPTTEPTVDPTTEPTVAPTTEPTVEPTTAPTTGPAVDPTAGPTASDGASVSADDVRQGGSLTFAGSGFLPGENVSGTVHSEPVSLGIAVADADGNVTFTWQVPASFEVGQHTVTLVGETSKHSVEATFNVLAAEAGPSATTSEGAVSPSGVTTSTPSNEGGLANTGATTTVLWSGALLLLLVGAGIVAGSRRRTGSHI